MPPSSSQPCRHTVVRSLDPCRLPSVAPPACQPCRHVTRQQLGAGPLDPCCRLWPLGPHLSRHRQSVGTLVLVGPAEVASQCRHSEGEGRGLRYLNLRTCRHSGCTSGHAHAACVNGPRLQAFEHGLAHECVGGPHGTAAGQRGLSLCPKPCRYNRFLAHQ